MRSDAFTTPSGPSFPGSEFPEVRRNARIYLAIYAIVIASAIVCQTWLPIFLFVLPQLFGTWLMIVHNTLAACRAG